MAFAGDRVIAIIPAFNEAENLGHSLFLLIREQQRHWNPIHEIVVVNDGSTDSTKDIANFYKRNVTVLEHKKNLGKSDAFLTGLRYARKQGASIILMLDADVIEYSSNAIGDLIQPLLKDKKLAMVVGQRKEGTRWGPSHANSGNRAIRVSALEPYFRGFRIWKQMLKGKRFGLEDALDYLIGVRSKGKILKSNAIFYQQPPFQNAFREGLTHGNPVERREQAKKEQVSQIRAIQKIIKGRQEKAKKLKQQRATRKKRP